MATKKSKRAAKSIVGNSTRLRKDASLRIQTSDAHESGVIGSSVKEVSNQVLLEEMKEKARQSRKHRVRKKDSFAWNHSSEEAHSRDRRGAPKPKFASAFKIGDMAKVQGAFQIPDGKTCMVISEPDEWGAVEALVEGQKLRVSIKSLRPMGWSEEE
jgi:hypothetical protein